MDSHKVGLGLWNSLPLTLLIEGGLFGLGIYLYLKAAPTTRVRAFWSLILFMSLIYIGNLFGPKPPVDAPASMIAGPALAMWIFVFWGAWIDSKG